MSAFVEVCLRAFLLYQNHGGFETNATASYSGDDSRTHHHMHDESGFMGQAECTCVMDPWPVRKRAYSY